MTGVNKNPVLHLCIAFISTCSKGCCFPCVPQESRKIPAREAASKTFAHACRAVTYA